MKTRNILSLCFAFCVATSQLVAQDLISLKNGQAIKAKIVEEANGVIKYKKWENLEGPRYVVRTSEAKSIKYQSGKFVNFEVVTTSTTPVVAAPAVDERANMITTQLKQFKNYALVIGVQDYEDKSINDLDHPVADAKRVMDILNTTYTFDKANTIFLQNPTRTDIIHAFDKLAKQVTPTDNLLIFYAGHGVFDTQLNKGYWLPRNAMKDDRSDWFSNSDLRDYIGGINTKHTLLVADACFSGSIFKTRDAFAQSPDANGALGLYKTHSRQAMTSGAMKSVPDKSVFIEYLCRRLKENQEAFVSAEQLFYSFKIAVVNNSPNGQVPQFGVIKETGDEGGDFLFIKR